MNEVDFDAAFQALTGNAPFPWQQEMYRRFAAGDIPASCNLPTGLGKTSVVAVWLIALANDRPVPRRLVYVVNRRTVVDQTTDEVQRYRDNLRLSGLFDPLAKLCGLPVNAADPPLALSTLRGQFADNREWSADPSRPAVVVGTVDMIGSRLLFHGYGIGRGKRPLHAGFLGQDALLIHDEAHLEPAFQDLLFAIETEQKRCRDFVPLRVMELSATSRGGGNVFELTRAEKEPPAEFPGPPDQPIHHVWRRTHSRKALVLHGIGDAKKGSAPKIVELALKYRDDAKQPAVLIFVRTVEAVNEVVAGLKKGKVEADNILTLTGTMRGYERDRMATEHPVFARFKKDSPAPAEQPGAVYLVCTAAGEVGVDISAGHLVCDLSTLDSMAQRFGRVNRYGLGDATIDVVHPTALDAKDDPLEAARERTLRLLENLRRRDDGQLDASPASLGERVERAIREGMGDGTTTDRTEALRKYVLAAFAPPPTILPVTDILFDAWALTTVRGRLPGHPPVEPYLHGLADRDPPETHVAWREEVEKLRPTYASDEERAEREAEDRKALARLAADLLDDFPVKPHELLREPSYRAFKQFEVMAKRCPDLPVWLLDDDAVQVLTVKDLADKDKKERIEGMTVLLPPAAGGLEGGMLNGPALPPADGKPSLDVSCELYLDKERTQYQRFRSEDASPPKAKEMRLVRRVPLPGGSEDDDPEYWYWFERGNEGGMFAKQPVEWCVHVRDVERAAERIVDHLPLGDDVRRAVKLAAKFHDHGKKRKVFQTVLGNPCYPEVVWAKSSGTKGGRVEEWYRHEFGSLVDLEREPEFVALADDEKELVRHLIAAHHGRARPHFPADEAFDPDRPAADADRVAREVPRRYARLQRKYGRWGLAYLESLLRAADWAASANPSKYWEGQQ